MPTTVVVEDRATLARHFADRFAAAARDAIAAHGSFVIALPGGSVAEAFFPALVDAPVDWSRVEVFWGDERAVPPTDPASNYGLARRLWLDHVAIPAARVHPIHGEDPDMDRAAAAYARELDAARGGRPIDLVVLGVGPEGHVCSLFPGHAALTQTTRSVVAIHDSPKPPPDRITLTLGPLAGAGLVCVAAFGAEKADAIHAAVDDPASVLPVALAARGGREALFLLDAAAAGRLAAR